MNSTKTVDKHLLLPVLMGFFIMGFCDLIAPITGHIAKDFPDHQSAVNFLPSMVFIWFFLLSTPIASLMNKIGRKQTAMIGYILSVVGFMIPYFAGESPLLEYYFVGFGLLGIGNTFVQVSINPLLATIVPNQKMTSYLTVGQIFRNTSILILTPMITLLIAYVGSWRLVLPTYAILTIVGGVWLQLTTVTEPVIKGQAIKMLDCFSLLKNPTVAICVAGISFFIAADVGVGFISSRLIDNPNSMLTTSAFYGFRIIGTIIGAYVLTRISDVKYLRWNMLAALALTILLMFIDSTEFVYATIALLGYTMACVFSTLYTTATKSAPENANEIAGLIIMAISAGTITGPAMGTIIQYTGEAQSGLIYIAVCVIYLVWASFKIKKH